MPGAVVALVRHERDGLIEAGFGAAHLAGAAALPREAGNVLPFDGQHQLPADDRG